MVHLKYQSDQNIKINLRNINNLTSYVFQSPERVPSSGWDAIKMNADEMIGDFRGGYSPSYPDYIISERELLFHPFFLLSNLIFSNFVHGRI